jgi:hypothetical protein
MVLPDVGDLAPIGFVVTGDAFRSLERAVVGILVTGHTLGLQAEERSVPAAVLAVVTVLASNRPVSAFERPTGLAMVEAVPPAAGPANEPRVPPEMLDVTSTAVLTAILAPVKTRLPPDLNPQVVVAAEASIRVDPLSRRVAFAAVRIAIDVGVGAGELSGGQKLSTASSRHQRSENGGHNHQGAHDHHCCDAPPHSEKIQRYP